MLAPPIVARTESGGDSRPSGRPANAVFRASRSSPATRMAVGFPEVARPSTAGMRPAASGREEGGGDSSGNPTGGGPGRTTWPRRAGGVMAPHDRGVVADDHVARERRGGARVLLDREGVPAECDDKGAGRRAALGRRRG